MEPRPEHEFVTPDRQVGRDIRAKSRYERSVRVTTDHRLLGVRREGNELIAEPHNEYTA